MKMPAPGINTLLVMYIKKNKFSCEGSKRFTDVSLRRNVHSNRYIIMLLELSTQLSYVNFRKGKSHICYDR